MSRRNVADIISSNITVSVTAKKPVRRDKKQRDFQYELQRFWDRIKKLQQEISEIDKNIQKVRKFYVKGAKDDKDIVKELEEKLNLIEQARTLYEKARKDYRRFMEDYSSHNSKSVKKLYDAIIDIREEAEQKLEEANDVLSGIAEERKPQILTDDNEVVDEILGNVVNKELKKLKKRFSDSKKQPKLGDSHYTIGGKRDDLIFARYIEVKNVPTMDGIKLDNYYIVLAADVDIDQSRREIDLKTENLYITMAPRIVEPDKLKNLYTVSSLKDASNALDQVAMENRIAMFRIEPFKKSKKADIIKQYEGDLNLLDEKGVNLNMDNAKGKMTVTISRITFPDVVEGNKFNEEYDKSLKLDLHKITKTTKSKKGKKGPAGTLYGRISMVDPPQIYDDEVVINYTIHKDEREEVPPKRGEEKKPSKSEKKKGKEKSEKTQEKIELSEEQEEAVDKGAEEIQKILRRNK